MPPRKNNRKSPPEKRSFDFNIAGVFKKSVFAVVCIMIGGLLFNLDRMGDTGIMLLKYKAFMPSYIVRFLPGGTAATGQASVHQDISGQVIEVYDGDTITVLTPKNIKYRIRRN